jgi:hypothetical protein
MSKHARWLFPELERWTEQGIISAEQAARIRALYSEPAGRLSWGLLVFFGLGAAILGLGVILLFAYNWDAIPKFAKMALIFGGIAAAHAAGWRLRPQTDWRSHLGEALSLLGTMGFGAGIWLIAQIYHIEEHFPNGFLIWALGALVLAWALESIRQAILTTVLFACWGGAETLEYGASTEIAILLAGAGVGALAWRKQSAVLAAVVLAAVYWLVLCNAAHWEGAAGVFGNAFALAVLLIAVAKLPLARGDDLAQARLAGVLRFFGWTGFIVCAFLLSFDDPARHALRWKPDAALAPYAYRWVLFVLAAAAWLAIARRARAGTGPRVPREEWLCPIALVYAQGLAFLGAGDAWFVVAVFNLVCLALAGAWMVRGCQEGRLRPIVIGSVLLGGVVFARYFDLFDSLAARGLAFILFGGVLFAEGFYYRRLRRAAPEGAG